LPPVAVHIKVDASDLLQSSWQDQTIAVLERLLVRLAPTSNI